jgi:hypothetical protein
MGWHKVHTVPILKPFETEEALTFKASKNVELSLAANR